MTIIGFNKLFLQNGTDKMIKIQLNSASSFGKNSCRLNWQSLSKRDIQVLELDIEGQFHQMFNFGNLIATIGCQSRQFQLSGFLQNFYTTPGVQKYRDIKHTWLSGHSWASTMDFSQSNRKVLSIPGQERPGKWMARKTTCVRRKIPSPGTQHWLQIITVIVRFFVHHNIPACRNYGWWTDGQSPQQGSTGGPKKTCGRSRSSGQVYLRLRLRRYTIILYTTLPY